MARANAVVPHIFRHLLAVTLLGNDVSGSAAMAVKMDTPSCYKIPISVEA